MSDEYFFCNLEVRFEFVVVVEAVLDLAYGTWREKKMYGKTYMGTLRSTFAIGVDGNLKWVGYKVGTKGHVDNLIEELEMV